MVVPTGSLPCLPNDVAITERSRQFYNGTYKWDSDGFTDEHGVYRKFDCYDPDARAPTPLPPMFSDDEEDDAQIDIAANKSTQSIEADGTTTSTDEVAFEPGTPCSKPKEVAANALDTRTPQETYHVALASNTSITNAKQGKRVLQNEPAIGSQEDDKLTSNLEFSAAASEQVGTQLRPEKQQKLGGMPRVTEEQVSHVKMPDTPPESPIKTAVDVQTPSPKSTTSTLSSIPSNLSNQGTAMGFQIKGAFEASRGTPSLSSTPSKSSPQQRTRFVTTRGVAQKVSKSSKKASGSKPSLPKRKDDSVEDFTLKELHSGAYMRTGGRRRSVRQAKSKNS